MDDPNTSSSCTLNHRGNPILQSLDNPTLHQPVSPSSSECPAPAKPEATLPLSHPSTAIEPPPPPSVPPPTAIESSSSVSPSNSTPPSESISTVTSVLELWECNDTFGGPSFQIARYGHQDTWLITFQRGSLPGHTSTSVEVRAWMRGFYGNRTDIKAPNKLVQSIENSKWDGVEFWSAIEKNLIKYYLRTYEFEADDSALLATEIKRTLKTWPIFCYRVLFSSWRILRIKGLVPAVFTICQISAIIAPCFSDPQWVMWFFVFGPLFLMLMYLLFKWIVKDGKPRSEHQLNEIVVEHFSP